MSLFKDSKAFTLIELIIVIAIIALIAAAVFVSVNPAKRLGDAKDAVRASDAVAIEKAIQKKIADGYTVPVSMAALTEDTPYMLVTEGTATSGTCNCNTLDESIARIDLAGEFKSYLGDSVPVDADATGDDTGYYITRKGNNFYIKTCNAYGDEYTGSTDPCAGTPAIGTVCDGGALYAGMGPSPYDINKYMVTPGNCTDSPTPTCAGGTDTLTKAYQTATVSVGATSNTDGQANTDLLAARVDTPAAKYCQDMVYGGYSDWFLPALDEIATVLNANRIALGDFGALYWSSTEQSNLAAWYYLTPGGPNDWDKTVAGTFLIRCVRRY